MERRLVQPGDRHRFQQEPVLFEVRRQDRRDLGTVLAPVVLQAVHRVARRHRQHRVDQLAFQRLGQVRRPERLPRQRLCRRRDALVRGIDPHVELGPDIDAQAVRGDDRLRPQPLDLEPRGLHVHFRDLVQEGQRDEAALGRDKLAAGTGPHQCNLARGLAIVPVEKQDHEDRNDDHCDDDQEPSHERTPEFPPFPAAWVLTSRQAYLSDELRSGRTCQRFCPVKGDAAEPAHNFTATLNRRRKATRGTQAGQPGSAARISSATTPRAATPATQSATNQSIRRTPSGISDTLRTGPPFRGRPNRHRWCRPGSAAPGSPPPPARRPGSTPARRPPRWSRRAAPSSGRS